jgi:hypothetical protein
VLMTPPMSVERRGCKARACAAADSERIDSSMYEGGNGRKEECKGTGIAKLSGAATTARPGVDRSVFSSVK